MADAIAKPVKKTIIYNPNKGFIRNPSQKEIQKYEKRNERLIKEGKK